ncbi:MAG: hypothetical protein WAO56_01490 [Miniphocaeibacter sp.]|uniref:alpha/beta hydrolase n=1 Tax=Miniphocaeibacter sp. TaxID=3100973 RepID=UPI003BAFD82D
MEVSKFMIKNIPVNLWGESKDKVFLYIHGKQGYKEETEKFAEIVCKRCWQVLSIDLPEHGDRKKEIDKFNPWTIVPELKIVMKYLKESWDTIGLRATSIGAWFSMIAFQDYIFERCLLVSPVIDMRELIFKMMSWNL